MYCEKCGTKNEPGSKFCEKCGHKFDITEPSKINEIIKNFKELPKKSKIIMGSVTIIIVLAIIFLTILLNNPIKKVRDNLETYYAKYHDNYTKELVSIGEILKDNRTNLDVLNDIKKTVFEEVNNWVKNFNTIYKDKDSLVAAYDKVNGAIYSIYSYYDGIDYMLNNEDYEKFSSELKDLYSSKLNYLYGSKEEDNYTKYIYYIKVTEEDSYYKTAQEYISDYVKDELESFKAKIAEDYKIEDNASLEEKLTKYLDALDYLKKNTISNNLDLSTTKDYQDLVTNYENEAIKLVKQIITTKKEKLEYYPALDLLNDVLKNINEDNSEYQDLEDLKSELESLLPDKLVNKYVVEYAHSNDSTYSTTINEEKYDNYLYFSFDGENAYRTYRLNKSYKTLKTKIVIGPDWPKEYSGKFIIYGDDKELFKTDTITKDTKDNLEITLDIIDVDDLKIVFETSNKSAWTECFYIYLVEPYLYK